MACVYNNTLDAHGDMRFPMTVETPVRMCELAAGTVVESKGSPCQNMLSATVFACETRTRELNRIVRAKQGGEGCTDG